jgi:hypothetical protein
MANKIRWEDLKCQEASVLSVKTYVPCAAPAVAIVWNNRDRRGYAMCEPCAYHNENNRGCVILVEKKDDAHAVIGGLLQLKKEECLAAAMTDAQIEMGVDPILFGKDIGCK